MPMIVAFNRSLNCVVLTVSGVVTWDERVRTVTIAERVLSGSALRNVLIDLSGLSPDNDPEESLSFRAHLKDKREAFRAMRIAIVRSQAFPLSSVHAQELQKFGIAAYEFETDADARAWLAGDQAAEDASLDAAPDEPIDLW